MKTQRYRGPECLSGLPGSGKSYWLVRYGVDALRRGDRVFSNAGFQIHDVHGCGRRSEVYFSLEELLTVPNGSTVLLDEAPVFVNSRKSNEFPRGLLYRLTQVRKDGLRFYYSSIDEMMVDANLRRVTFWTWEHEAWPFGLFRRRRWAPVDRRVADDKPVERGWFRVKSAYADAYDTLSKVWIPPEVVEALLADVVKGWVPLTDELVDCLWSGGRDVDRARQLLAKYQARAQTMAEESMARGKARGSGGPAGRPKDARRAPREGPRSNGSNGDGGRRVGSAPVVPVRDLLPAVLDGQKRGLSAPTFGRTLAPGTTFCTWRGSCWTPRKRD